MIRAIAGIGGLFLAFTASAHPTISASLEGQVHTILFHTEEVEADPADAWEFEFAPFNSTLEPYHGDWVPLQTTDAIPRPSCYSVDIVVPASGWVRSRSIRGTDASDWSNLLPVTEPPPEWLMMMLIPTFAALAWRRRH
jgi:hypothetical protein